MDLRPALAHMGPTPMRRQSSSHKLAYLPALLLCGLLAAPVLAEEPGSFVNCANCLGAGQCNQRTESCRSECRSRLFAVDPHRDACLQGCAESHLKCAETSSPRQHTPAPQMHSGAVEEKQGGAYRTR